MPDDVRFRRAIVDLMARLNDPTYWLQTDGIDIEQAIAISTCLIANMFDPSISCEAFEMAELIAQITTTGGLAQWDIDIDHDYVQLMLVGYIGHEGNGAQSLSARVDGDTTASSYSNLVNYSSTSGLVVNNSVTNAWNVDLAAAVAGANQSPPMSWLQLTLMNYQVASLNTMMRSVMYNPSNRRYTVGMHHRVSAEVNTALNLFVSGGENIAAGTLYLLGVGAKS